MSVIEQNTYDKIVNLQRAVERLDQKIDKILANQLELKSNQDKILKKIETIMGRQWG